jgi:hypothetical protein
MTAFRRFSTRPGLPDGTRGAEDDQAANWHRTVPIAAWSRTPTFLVLQGQERSGLSRQSRAPSPGHVRRAGRTVAVRACFLGPKTVLAAAHLLLSAGLLRSGGAGKAQRWSSRLTATGMRLWRHGRLRTRL